MMLSGFGLFANHPGKSDEPSINWPAGFHPNEAKFYVQNRIDVNAPPEIVWEFLMDAEAWPQWYEGAGKVNIVDPAEQILTANSVFTWKTMGLNFESTIEEFIPNERLSWMSSKKSIQGYHAWLIIPTEFGCTVITEETQNGWLTFFEKIFQPNKLHKLHDIWLAELKKLAEAKVSEQNYNPDNSNLK
jgi:uncharacterized protein YndB with AHSA1/START domain